MCVFGICIWYVDAAGVVFAGAGIIFSIHDEPADIPALTTVNALRNNL